MGFTNDTKIIILLDADIFIHACKAYIEREENRIEERIHECILSCKKEKNEPWRKYHKSLSIFKIFKKEPVHYTFKQVGEELLETYQKSLDGQRVFSDVVWCISPLKNRISWAERHIDMAECAKISEDNAKIILDGDTFCALRVFLNDEVIKHIDKDSYLLRKNNKKRD